LSKIVSIGTALPKFRHEQSDIMDFMQTVYAVDEKEKRKLRYLYGHSGIETRYSVLPDFSLPAGDWSFFPATENLEPFPTIDERLQKFQQLAPALSLDAINKCLEQDHNRKITHLITVSCTGMSAPGLDLELLSMLGLPSNTWRTSVNFMGCYAAIHAMKLADLICKSDPGSNVLIICVECCTLHFQKEYEESSVTSSLLFGDGAAAMLVTGDPSAKGLAIDHFYSLVDHKGKNDMQWEISSRGFLMQLSSEIPSLIQEDLEDLVTEALAARGVAKHDITDWCIHPGGKRILEAVEQSLALSENKLSHCYDVMREFGNMSSPTVVFVLDRIWRSFHDKHQRKIFGAAFGPGLTMESFILSA
jgi:predicted naringenin-chalcone synthase